MTIFQKIDTLVNFNLKSGFYHSHELKVVYEIKVTNDKLFVYIKNLGNVNLILKNNLEFWFGQIGASSGRFIVSDQNIILGFNLLDYPRAPNILFTKYSNEPVC
jgi:hypothetical protein